MNRRRVAMVIGAVVVAAAAALVVRRGGFGEPADLVIERVVRDFGSPWDVVAQRADAPVRLAGIRPGTNTNFNAGYRTAIVASAPAAIRYTVPVPADASLRFSTGVQMAGAPDPDAPGIRFSVRVDGERVFSRTREPHAHRRERKWLDDEVDLGAWAGRDVTLELATEVDGSGDPGLPGWSAVRLVRRLTRPRQPAASERPNVLILLVDTLRADRLGCYGAAPSPSPALDRLGARGLVFEQAIAQAPWTLPSIATMFTGLHPRSHGAVAWPFSKPAERPENGSTVLPDTLASLPEEAALAGVTTFGVSANPLVSHTTHFARGFETFVDLPPDLEGDMPRRAGEVNDAFLRWVRGHRDRRFLAYLHYMDVHEPYWPPPEFRPEPPAGIRPAIARGRLAGIAEKVNWRRVPPLADAEIRHLEALYTGAIRAWDAELGRLLDALAALGILDRTIVVVTADHGEAFQEHGKLTHGPDLYDELLRVPFVVAGPGIPAGRRADQVQGIDVFPTVGALLGLAVPSGLPGLDVLARRDARPAFSETSLGIVGGRSGSLVSLRTLDWKLIHAPALPGFELYDVARDPGERIDRFATAPEGQALVATLADWKPAPPPAAFTTEASPVLQRQLRALGYVE